MTSKVLLTGASGFLGKRVAECLIRAATIELSVILRGGFSSLNANCHYLKSIDSKSDFSQSLAGQDVVIHTAARVHVMQDVSLDPLSEFRRVNVGGTLNLARQAVIAGVKRFIFISSIKVNGEYTRGSNFFNEDGIPDPCDPYAVSKAEAEKALLLLASESEMEVVIIRPPLIYGPGVKGNFLTLVNAVRNGIPLPLGAVNNKRSLVALDNVVDLIITCIDHPKAANQVFLVSDGEDVSTSLLLSKIAIAFNTKAWLMPIPGSVIKIIAKLIGKGSAVDRLYGSLRINDEKARHLLGWKSVITMDEQLSKLAIHLKGNIDPQ